MVSSDMRWAGRFGSGRCGVAGVPFCRACFPRNVALPPRGSGALPYVLAAPFVSPLARLLAWRFVLLPACCVPAMPACGALCPSLHHLPMPHAPHAAHPARLAGQNDARLPLGGRCCRLPAAAVFYLPLFGVAFAFLPLADNAIYRGKLLALVVRARGSSLRALVPHYLRGCPFITRRLNMATSARGGFSIAGAWTGFFVAD